METSCQKIVREKSKCLIVLFQLMDVPDDWSLKANEDIIDHDFPLLIKFCLYIHFIL